MEVLSGYSCVGEVELWTATISPGGRHDAERILRLLEEYVREHPNRPVLGHQYNGHVVLTRYVRPPYELLGVPVLQRIARELTDRSDGSLHHERPCSGIRVVLGLNKGYSQTQHHKASDVGRALPLCHVSSGKVFSVRSNGDGVSVYTEPAAIITGSEATAPDIARLALASSQERFVVENFKLGVARTYEVRS